jgi:signal transduction histidine kinase/DNA-binding NarL/FixJ family response regulator
VIEYSEHSASEIESLLKENKALRSENKRLGRELKYERDLNERNRISAEVKDNVSKIISAEKDRLKKYMNLLLTNCPDIIMFFDQEGRVVLVSDSYLRSRKIQTFGMIRGQSYRELLSDMEEKFLENVDGMFRAGLAQKSSAEFECDIDFGGDGNFRYYHIQLIPMAEESGVTEGAMFLFYDTTEITRAKIEAERARELAEQSTRAKSEFLSRMSHEIRTPMNAILGMAELLLRKDIPQNARADALGIKHAGSSLLSIINDILDFSKIESGKMDIVPAEYNLASLIHDVINIIRVRVVEKSVLFTVYVIAAIPGRLEGDELRIRQVLLNLLSNAVKYTHSGHIEVDIDAESDESDRLLLRFAVADTGIGIREEDIEKLFIDFSQINTPKNRQIQGTGLGLSIARNLCRLMGGEITVKSNYGTGSVFTAIVPQRVVDRAPCAFVRDATRKTVLFCEKRQVYADSIARTLDNLGVPYTVVQNAADFYKALETGDYRFAFLSSAVYEKVQERVKNFFPDVAVVVLFDADMPPAGQKVYTLPMPAYSMSIANVLNGETETFVYDEGDGVSINFVAPTARVLVVDDIPTNLKVVAGLMSPYRMQVDCCESGVEAVRLVQENRYDMALIDHMMPEMDGFETVAAIRATGSEYCRKLPLIAFTANAMQGMREMFLKKGFDDYLSKPIEIRKLHEIVDTWIPREKRRQAVYRETKGETDAPPNGRQGRGTDAKETNIKGINFAAGVKQFGGEDAYLEILHSYLAHTASLLEKLKDVSKENLKDYAVTIHGIKGASYGIFAMTAGKEAEALELAAKAGDFETVEAKNGAFVENAERLLSDLNTLFAERKKSETDKPVQERPDDVLLGKMLSASKRFKSSEMEEILAELESYEYRHDADLVPWLREQADNLEYEAIEKRLGN